jgi:F420H(2)-dependent quinone reductase
MVGATLGAASQRSSCIFAEYSVPPPWQRGSFVLAAGAVRLCASTPARSSMDSGATGLGGRTIPVTAEQLHGAEREEAWRQITAAASRFAAYQRKTDRELPIIRLTPRSG